MTTPDDMVARLKSQARPWPRGNRFEDFEIGRKFAHHWGRTISQADSQTFSILTLHYNPHYTNEAFAVAHGHPTTPVNPLLVFNTVFGLSVEDLSEGGGPFLGVNKLEFAKPVYPGDTLYAQSEVIAARLSDKRPGYGIATWKTVGTNQNGEVVVSYERSNLVRTREQS
jgi:acyl dehydratase